jgi:hypothetical protein
VGSTDVNEGAGHVPTTTWLSGRPSVVVILLRRLTGGQPIYLDPRGTRATIHCDYPRRLLRVSVGSLPGKPRLRGGLCHPRLSSFAHVLRSCYTGSSAFFISHCCTIALIKIAVHKQLLGGAHVRWNSAGVNVGGSELSGTASDVGFEPTQMRFYNAAELRTLHYDRMRTIPLSGLDPSTLIGFLCKVEAD